MRVHFMRSRRFRQRHRSCGSGTVWNNLRPQASLSSRDTPKFARQGVCRGECDVHSKFASGVYPRNLDLAFSNGPAAAGQTL